MDGEKIKCPLCNLEAKSYLLSDGKDHYRIICDRCGGYFISDDCLKYGANIDEIGYILSGLAREIQETKGKMPLFLTTNIDDYANQYPVPDLTVIENKAKKLLQRLRGKTSYFGETIILDKSKDYPLAYAKNRGEFTAILHLMQEKKLLNNIRVSHETFEDPIGVEILADGWDLTNKLSKENRSSDQGFIAVWFDDSMNESIKAMEDAIRETGYYPVCIRNKHFSEKIMDKALGEIRKSRFVIVDLTGNRGSIFFEAGFAFGLEIETIYVYQEKEDEKQIPLEFYVRHYQCYKYKDLKELKEVVKNAINARIKK